MFQIGDRVQSTIDGEKADVVGVSKDGKRIKVSCWTGGARPKLITLWVAANGYVPFRRAA